MESVFILLFVFLDSCLWNMVSVGRWSDIGGEMVPAVILFVLAVSTGSISVAELWVVSYLVGVVMVVWRLLLRSRIVRGCNGRSANKFIFKSPCTVMCVFGCMVSMLSNVFCRFCCMISSFSGLCFGFVGRLYMLMMVCVGLVFCMLSCIWMVMDAMLGIVILFIIVMCKFSL